MRKFIDIVTEAPVKDWTIDPDLDANEAEMISQFHGYEKEIKHWPDVDKAAMRDPEVFERVRSAFLKTRHDFYVYFWQSKNPDYDRTLQRGLVDVEWVREWMGENAARYVENVPQDGITVIMTNNLSDEHPISIRSPWMVGHRIAHAIVGGEGSNPANNTAYWMFDEFVQVVLTTGYGLQWPDEDTHHGRIFAEDYLRIYGVMMGEFLGTFRSARAKKIVQTSEWKFETFTQYLLTGKITLNPLPEVFDKDPDGTPVLSLTRNRNKRAEVERIWREFPGKLEAAFEKVLKDAQGHIWVI